MKKIIILVVIVLLIGFFWFRNDVPPTPDTSDSILAPIGEGIITTPPAPTENIKEFTVIGSNFAFTPKTLEVKQGDTVKITFQNSIGFHDFKLDEFKVATKQIKVGESETIEFVADKTGTFEYYCSVGTHRTLGMKGTLTVK